MSATGPPQSARPLRGKRRAAPLGGDTSTARIDTILFDLGEPERPMLVGHDPDFSDLAAWMIGAQLLSLKKGALVRIDTVRPISADSGTLRWLVPPDLLQGR